MHHMLIMGAAAVSACVAGSLLLLATLVSVTIVVGEFEERRAFHVPARLSL